MSNGIPAAGIAPPIKACPPEPRWLYAFEDSWQTFSDEDDKALEARWIELKRRGLLGGTSHTSSSDNAQEKGTQSDKKTNVEASLGSDSLRDAVSSLKLQSERVGNAVKSGTTTPKEEQKIVVDEHLDPDTSEEDRLFRVEVMEDKLFDVDLETMSVSELNSHVSLHSQCLEAFPCILERCATESCSCALVLLFFRWGICSHSI